MQFQLIELNIFNSPPVVVPQVVQSVQYTINPVAGLGIASICASVILGGKNPLVVDSSSKIDELCGFCVPIPT